MAAQIRMLIAATGFALAMGGCDRGWREFQQIELGQVLPQQSLLRSYQDEAGTPESANDAQAAVKLLWCDSGVWPVPLSLGMHTLAVRTDADGRVISKSYSAQAWSNYILLTAVAVRYVVELEAPPPRMLPDPTAKTVDDGKLVGVESSYVPRSHLTSAMYDVNLHPKALGQPFPLLLVAVGANFMAVMSAYGGFHDLKWAIEHLPLDGIEQDGYDRTFRPVPGGSIRLRNLGQRRFRIDLNLFRLYDPLALAGYLYVQWPVPE